MVFMLESNVVSRKPVRVVQIETKTYEKKVEEIVIENQFPANASFKLSMTQQQLASAPGDGNSGMRASGSSSMAGNLPSSRAGGSRRNIQDRPAPGSSVNLSQTSDVAAFGIKKPVGILGGKTRAEDTDSSWCICSQQPFYLPEFGTFGSNTNAGANGDNSSTTEGGGGLLVPPTGTGAALTIRKNGSAKVKLEFLPLVPGNYKCQLLFLDENIGEFIYEVHAVAHLPASLETLEIQCEASNAASGSGANPGAARFRFARELTIPVKNPLLTRALAVFVERANGHLRTKLKDGLKRCEESHHTSFHVDFNSPFFTATLPELTLTSGAPGKLPPATGRSDGPGSEAAGPKVSLKANQARLGTPRSTLAGTNSVLLDFQPKGAGRYACKLLLRSHNTACGSSDLRVYDLVAKVKEPNVKTHLEFVSPARHTIVQEIPISNPTDTTWSLKATFSSANIDSSNNSTSGGKAASMFAGPLTLVVPAKRSASYPLTFTPTWICHETRTFILVNASTQQQFEFELSGYGEEPLAQDHVVLTCQARASIVHNFDVFALPGGNGANDIAGPQVFKVESDLRDVVGAPTITVPAGASGSNRVVKYPLTFSPLVSGSYFGSITFTNEATNEYLWYTVEASVSPPEPETTLEMQASPLWLNNPSDQELHLQYRISNTRNFSIKGSNTSSTGGNISTKNQPRVLLAPFGRASVIVEYTPSSLSDFETTSIVFFEKDRVSDWEFSVRGRGRAPSVMKPLIVTARVQEAASTLFTFKNPFAGPLRVDVKLVAEGAENRAAESSTSLSSASSASSVFDMLLKKRRVLLDGFGLLQVPISFLPSAVTESRAELVVNGNEEYAELEWRYPLRGVAEAPLHPRALAVLACQARDSVEKSVECELLAMPSDMMLADEIFTISWEIDAERFGPMATATAIERALTVTPLALSSSSRPNICLPYTIRFEPLRPYRGPVVLLVKKQSGGLWRFDVTLDAGDPPVDDVLTIESSLNQTSSVSFQLRNQFRESAAFSAEFSIGSSSAFTVYPNEGELPPYGSEDGVPFVVSFTPTGYGKMQSGQLVITTEEMQWTFNVKGTYPDATPGSRASGPASSLSLSSSASRARLGITTDSGNSSGSRRGERTRGRSMKNR
ncbi:Cilia- and flagella-associated protein 47 [Phytophthora boehmeriae]|uniref:Cilia- and flagella-associated protein 47 n=1 Tax=Phytophthora boehmeriae TaxID=109152 RepID=A0A8T1WX18_9STRA|nr:Cilia- and flagella-associated protein 47 [Phytophthora boehmeriae]